MTQFRQYKATGLIRFSIGDIVEESVEDVRKRFQEPSLLYGEFDAAKEHGAFEIDSLEIEDLGPCDEQKFLDTGKC